MTEQSLPCHEDHQEATANFWGFLEICILFLPAMLQEEGVLLFWTRRPGYQVLSFIPDPAILP